MIGQEARFLQDWSQGLGHRPEEAIAIFKIIGPFLVGKEVGPADLDLNDREFALGPDRHQVGAPAVWQRYLAHREQVMPAK
jgi:hypothetical protein